MSIDFKEFKRIDCREVARRLGMEIDRSGKTRCFHSPGDANPSLQIYPDGFKCFRDGESGDQIDLVSQYLGISKSDAAEWIGREFNVQQPPSRKNDYGKLEREHIYPGGTIKKCMYRRADKSKYGEWYHLENGKWLKGRGEGIPPLYPSSDNLASHIFLTEGEKDVDTWRRLGKSAISLPIAMTTDEIAAAVQAGDADILELWRAVERFVWKMARRKIASLDGKRGVDVFDLAQVGFISMLEALNRFDAAKGGSFIGQLSMSLKTGFAEATGSRTARAFNEPLDNSISIETPLTDEENADVLGDAIPDLAAEKAIDAVAEADMVCRLHDALENALSTLPQEQADALRTKYYEERPADARACQKGLRALRHPNISKELKDFL